MNNKPMSEREYIKRNKQGRFSSHVSKKEIYKALLGLILIGIIFNIGFVVGLLLCPKFF